MSTESVISDFDSPSSQLRRILTGAVVLVRLTRFNCALEEFEAMPEGQDPPLVIQQSSGFLVRAGGRVFLVTAAHVLARERPDGSTWCPPLQVDLLHSAGASGPDDYLCIPFGELEYRAADDIAAGIDIGVVALNPDHLIRLKAMGCTPFEEETWRNQDLDPDAFVVAGFPKEFQAFESITREGDTLRSRTSAGLVFALLRSTSVPMDPDRSAHMVQLEQMGRPIHGPWPDHFLDSWNGMSGGPIVAVTDHGLMVSVSLIAIQSEEEGGLVRGSLVRDFLALAADLASSARHPQMKSEEKQNSWLHALEQVRGEIATRLAIPEAHIDLQAAAAHVLQLTDPLELLERSWTPQMLRNLVKDVNFKDLAQFEEVICHESYVAEGAPNRLDEEVVRHDSEVWKIHKYDLDPFPSSPHAHLYESGLKMHLGNGKQYVGKRHVATLPCKRLKEFRNRVKNLKALLPPLECD